MSSIRFGRLRWWHGRDDAGTTRARTVVKRVACAVIACAGAVTLATSVHTEVHQSKLYTGPVWTSEYTRAYVLEECLYHAIRSAVPEGARVYVRNPDAGRAQQLAELSTLWAVPQTDLTRARWALTISDETLAGYLHHKHHPYVTYRYCPGALLTVKNLAKARQAARIKARHHHKLPKVGHL